MCKKKSLIMDDSGLYKSFHIENIFISQLDNHTR